MTTAIPEPMTHPADRTASKATPSARPHTRATPATSVERLVLTGFMGSGKSTVGKLLAKRLGWHFIDLDELIEDRTGMSVPKLFADRGEHGFRKEETLALAAALRRNHAVIALGGGAPETLGNRLLLEQTPSSTVVYLAASLETLTARCTEQSTQPLATFRPLLSDAAGMEARFRMRQPMYRRLAHHVADTEGETPDETTEKILSSLDLH